MTVNDNENNRIFADIIGRSSIHSLAPCNTPVVTNLVTIKILLYSVFLWMEKIVIL